MRPHVLILNGIGSVGKTSTAKALQKLSSKAFLHVQGDAFLEMMPDRLWGDPNGIIFERLGGDVRPSIEIKTGPALDQLMDGMRNSVAALARAGNNCIVDDVMLSSASQQLYRTVCADFTLQFVGLHAPLEILEQRERDRGDRVHGLARWQYGRVHHGIEYDFEIDTSIDDAEGIALLIASALDLSDSDR